jgi:hypothetical protein
MESWFTAPQFVLMENRALIKQSLSFVQQEAARDGSAKAMAFA